MSDPRFPPLPPAPRPLPAPVASEPARLTARTLEGLEWVLARELEGVGARDLRIGRRTIEFSAAAGAERETLYRAVLESRTAIRVLEPLGRFRVASPEELYRAVQEVDWTEQLKVSDTLRVDAAIHDTFTTHSLFAAQVVKDAIVDQLRTPSGKRPSVQLRGATLRLALHLVGDVATIFRDAAGRSLHQRGWRMGEVEAPLSEALAAGILAIAGWWRPGERENAAGGEPVLDPFCGSGTLVIEAATIAAGMAPGLWRARRQAHGFCRFRDRDRDLIGRLVAELEARVRASVGSFVASDLDPRAVEAARACAAAAGVGDVVAVAERHFEEVRPTGGPGLVVTNPPYGERLPLPRAGTLFRRLGDWLVRHCGGWRGAILAADTPAAQHLGLRPERRVPLANGSIPCRLLEVAIRQRANGERAGSSAASGGEPHPHPAGASSAPGRVPSLGGPGRRADGERAGSSAASGGEPHPHPAGASSAPGGVPSLGGPGRCEDGERAGSSAARATASHLTPHGPARTPGSGSGSRPVDHQIGDLRRRLAKRFRHLSRWARRQGTDAFRVYDRDIPEIPLVIDWYAGWLHVAEYDRPHDRTEIEHEVWLDRMVEAAAAELGVPAGRAFLKARRRQRDGGQYGKVDDRQALVEVHEGDLAFECNLSDYLDTGLFLDHRITRGLVRAAAGGKRFLNLFCYTGSFSVHAAAGGAAATTSVDLSNTYLDWTRTNLARNGFRDAGRHRTVRDEARAFLEHRARRGEPPFDIVVCDPPTFSRSARSETPWDVQQDHADLLALVAMNLVPGGVVYFSTNFRRFHLDGERLAAAYTVREITRQTLPEDFREGRPHRAWRLVTHGAV